MLKAAAEKNLYAALAEGDLLGWLRADTRTWPVIVAADVMIYFDALTEVFSAVRARLASDGVFIFSLEEKTAAVTDASAGRLDAGPRRPLQP